jgi:hypothetical protein
VQIKAGEEPTEAYVHTPQGSESELHLWAARQSRSSVTTSCEIINSLLMNFGAIARPA